MLATTHTVSKRFWWYFHSLSDVYEDAHGIWTMKQKSRLVPAVSCSKDDRCNIFISSISAINLQYFGLKSGRTTFENNFNFIRKQFETDSLLLNPKDSNYRIVKGFAQRSEKGDYFGLTNKKPFRDTLNIPILWCKLELHHSYSKFPFACKSQAAAVYPEDEEQSR